MPTFYLYQMLLVDDQLELKPQLIRRFPAQNHSFHKNFKKVHNRAESGIYVQIQNDLFIVRIDFEF